MTVYVDDMTAPINPEHVPSRTYVMSHMIGDTEAELHAMAAKIGVKRKWYQGDHYDIAQTKRRQAIKEGARSITLRQAAVMMRKRRRGLPMGTPQEAQAELDRREIAQA